MPNIVNIMNRSFLARCAKYSLAFIGFVIGSEIVFNCTLRLFAWLRKSKSDHHEYYRVIFFPDEGILTLNYNNKQSLNGVESSFDKQSQDLPIPNNQTEMKVPCNSAVARKAGSSGVSSTLNCPSPAVNAENSACHLDKACYMNKPSQSSTCVMPVAFTSNSEVSNLGLLSKSTSLIHMVHVLESAKKSLMVCVYLLSCSDLVEAIIRAKVRGVKVRVILDKGMSSVSNTSPLLQNSIPVRYSKPSQMMHNKFAVIDSPEVIDNTFRNSQQQDSELGNGGLAETLQNKNISLNYIDLKQRQHSEVPRTKNDFHGILMTGSFNWTWSGVVSNHENVVITNNKFLVMAFAEEFEKLWNAFEFVPPVNN